MLSAKVPKDVVGTEVSLGLQREDGMVRAMVAVAASSAREGGVEDGRITPK